MKLYISKNLEISEEEAFILQKRLYKQYGTTLFGLMKFHKFNPEEFLDFVHDINLSKLKQSKELKDNIDLLPGKKMIFTNGDEKWAKKILYALGIYDSVEKIFDIIKSDYIPKPQKKAYSNMIEMCKVNPKECIFFEDTKINLLEAHNFGMVTIHIDEKFDYEKKYELEYFVDFKFKSIEFALKTINKHLK